MPNKHVPVTLLIVANLAKNSLCWVKMARMTQNLTVNIKTRARLHVGFYDLTGNGFGSVGIALDAPCTQIEVIKNQTVVAPEAQKIAQVFADKFGLKQAFSLKILEQIPSHVGLGSGTQMALAVGASLNKLFDLGMTPSEIATIAKRGSRSGIGLVAFEQGGFLVDSGKNADALPEVAIRHDFPAHWRIILVGDNLYTGVHGAAELQAFKMLKPMQNHLKDMVTMHMAPALARADLLAFGAYMQDLQTYNGAYFAPVQGGHYASKSVENALSFLRENGVACLGQSSWGPTGFAIVESEEIANLQINTLKTQFIHQPNLSFSLSRGYNKGATLE